LEAKAGYYACKVGNKAGEDVVGCLNALPGVKSGVKDISKGLEKHGWAVMAVPVDKKGKKIANVLKAKYDSMLFTTSALPAAAWSQEVYQLQLYASAQYLITIAVPHLGLMEARLAIEGSETCCAIKVELIPGQTLFDKRQWVLNACAQDLQPVVNKGVKVTNDGTGVCVFPTGVMVISVSRGVKALRWSLSSDDADDMRVKVMIRSLVEGFEEHRVSQLHQNFLISWRRDRAHRGDTSMFASFESAVRGYRWI
jgi:hypothetical protein